MVLDLRRMRIRLLAGGLIFFAAYGAWAAWGVYQRAVYPFPYRRMVFEYAERAGLDPYLVAAVIRAESRFNPGAESDRGALGLMQVMPDTGTWAAGRMGIEGFRPDQLADPGTNLMIGTWYLAYLMAEFDGDAVAALAAYNGGLGRVRAWIEEGLLAGRDSNPVVIPYPETRRFVAGVLGDSRRYRGLYGGRGDGV